MPPQTFNPVFDWDQYVKAQELALANRVRTLKIHDLVTDIVDYGGEDLDISAEATVTQSGTGEPEVDELHIKSIYVVTALGPALLLQFDPEHLGRLEALCRELALKRAREAPEDRWNE